jgi:hypothetical protein
MANLRLAVWCIGCAMAQPGWASEIDLQSSLPDAVKVATRMPATGTNLQRAKVDARALGPDTIASSIERAAIAAFQDCGGKVKVVASELPSHDFIGDTSTRLSGYGLYVSTSEKGLRGSGTGFIAPYVSVRLEVSGAGLGKPRALEIFDSERIEIARSDTLEFIQRSKETERAVISYAGRVIEQRLHRDVASGCKPA